MEFGEHPSCNQKNDWKQKTSPLIEQGYEYPALHLRRDLGLLPRADDTVRPRPGVPGLAIAIARSNALLGMCMDI